MTETWKKFAFAHARKCHPEECCGMLIKKQDNIIYGPCNNLAKHNAEMSFVIDPKDWADYEDQGEVVGIVHSHPQDILEFSEGDKYSCKAIDLTFYLVSPKSDKIKVMHPSELNA